MIRLCVKLRRTKKEKVRKKTTSIKKHIDNRRFFKTTLRHKNQPEAGFLMLKEWWEVNFFESLILAQDKRWRRALGMQIKGVR